MKYDDLTDEELMVSYQTGAEEAFRVIYQRHSSKIFGYIKAKVKTDERARDIFQEVFVKIHRSKNLYNKSFPALPWLFTVTRTVLIDEIRKEKPLELIGQEIELAENRVAERPDLPSLGYLPETQKAAIHMRYVEERTFAEIAELLKTSPDNVRQLVSRGVKKLRSLFKSGAES